MNNLVKNLVKLVAAGLLLWFSNLFLPIIAGAFIAVKLVEVAGAASRNSYRKRMGPAMADADDATVIKSMRMHNEKAHRNYFSPMSERWNDDVLPADMNFSMSSLDSPRKAYFNCCGLENVIVGEYLGTTLLGSQDVVFSMNIRDQRLARKFQEYIATNGIVGASVLRNDDGSFRIVCDNADDITSVVKEFYPPRTMRVEREVRTVRQYIVSASSQEEAAELVRKGGFQPANEYTVRQDTVDGVRDPNEVIEAGSPLTFPLLSVDQYLVNVTDTKVYSHNVTFNARYDATDDALRSDASDCYIDRYDDTPGARESSRLSAEAAFECKQADLVEDRCSREPSVAVVDNEHTNRYLVCDGETLAVADREALDAIRDGCRLYVQLSSLKDVEDIVSGKVTLDGFTGLVDSQVPSGVSGGYVLSFPVTEEMLGSLEPCDSRLSRLRESYSSGQIDEQGLRQACLADRMERLGYETVIMHGNIGMQGAMINGVPVSDVAEQREAAAEGRAETLRTVGDKTRWMANAARIERVDMELDMRNHELLTTAYYKDNNLGSMTQRDRRSLTDEEVIAMSGRAGASQGELKDLVMRMHPDVFDMYGGEGAARYEDPMRDFIQSRRPVKVKGQETAAVQPASDRKEKLGNTVELHPAVKGRKRHIG